jgi:hypothetical protein
LLRELHPKKSACTFTQKLAKTDPLSAGLGACVRSEGQGAAVFGERICYSCYKRLRILMRKMVPLFT